MNPFLPVSITFLLIMSSCDREKLNPVAQQPLSPSNNQGTSKSGINSMDESDTVDIMAVNDLFNNWLDASQQQDIKLDYYYSETVWYYQQKNYNKIDVLRDKAKFFKNYTNFRIKVFNSTTIKERQGEYVIEYDKIFNCFDQRRGKPYSGKVRSLVGFSRIDNKWVISMEKDIKIYFLNKNEYTDANHL